MQPPPNILFYLQDKSITNILSFVLESKKINSINYNENQNTFLKTSFKLIILDNDLDINKKNNFIFKLKKHNIKSKVLLAISNNYTHEINSNHLNEFRGIIYKPFDIEEVINIITQ
jgi:DNA-binding response OmpR family regulator